MENIIRSGKMTIYKKKKLAPLTTYNVGGPAEYYCEPSGIAELKTALGYANGSGLKITVLGGGANILVADGGIKGLVISTRKMRRSSVNGGIVVAECGLSVKELNNKLLGASLSGMEWSGGLPGTVGGAVFMNARAYGKQMSDVVSFVCAMDRSGRIINFTNAKLSFGYKKSVFMERDDLIILSATLELKKGKKREIGKLYKYNMTDRKNKGQFDHPSCGSVFKNDHDLGIPSGRIIDEAGLKGARIGGAQVSEQHGNFIFNTGRATADDIRSLIELVEKEVYQKKGVKLEREIRLIGF